MRLDIRPQVAPQLTGLTAISGINSVSLTWDIPASTQHKATEIWAGNVNDVTKATKLATVNDFAYVVVNAEASSPLFYWVRSVSVYGRTDGPWSNSVSKAGNAVSGTAAKMISLGASSQIFGVNKVGASAPAVITLFASAQNLQGFPTWSIISGTGSLNSTANAYEQTLVFSNMTSDLLTVEVSQDGLKDQLTIVKVKDGSDTVTGMLTNETANVAADAFGTVSSFVNVGGSFRIFEGTVDKSSSATFALVSATGMTISISAAGVYSVSAMSADTASATLRATYKGLQIEKVYTLAKTKQGNAGPAGSGSTGAQGPRGTVDIASGGYSSWSNAAANAAISSAGYGSPINRDRVTLYGSGYSETRFYDYGSWIAMAAFINGNMLVSGTLSADKLSGGTITGMNINIGGHFRVAANGNGTVIYSPEVYRQRSYNSDAPGIAAITAMSSGSGAAVEVYGSGNSHAIGIAGGRDGIVQYGANTNWMRTIVANGQNSFDLGASDYAWRNIFALASPIIVSDRRTKTDIEETVLGLEFIQKLRPVSYRMKVGTNIVVDHQIQGPDTTGVPLKPKTEFIPVAGIRRHFGLIAQEVCAALEAHEASDAGIWTQANPDDPESQQALRYEELISPMIKAIQQLSDKVDQLTTELEVLKAG